MTALPLAPIVETLPAGIETVSLPTPFPVGPVNCYLLLGDPLTVVDPGMLWADTIDLLTAALAGHGHSIADVAQIIVTHGHPDHFGAAGWLCAHSDSTVIAGRPEVPKLLGPLDPLRLQALGAGLGIPDATRRSFTGFYETVGPLTHPVDPGRLQLVDDGNTIAAGGRVWQAHVTPGHAVGHLSLYDPGQRTLISGDHLLACITPNPLLEPDPHSPLQRRRSLVEYLDSLDRFCRLDPVAVLPGHGPRFADVPVLVEAVRAHHADRAQHIHRVVRDCGEPTAFELVRSVFPELDGFSIMLGLSEIVGHLDLLEAAGTLTRTEDTPYRYQPI